LDFAIWSINSYRNIGKDSIKLSSSTNCNSYDNKTKGNTVLIQIKGFKEL